MNRCLRPSVSTDYERVMRKRNLSVRPPFMVVALVATMIVAVIGVRFIISTTIDLPVVYKSWTTGEVIKVEIGSEVYFGNDIDIKKISRYELVWEK